MKRVLKALYRGWMVFAGILGRIQTFLILLVIYFAGIGIISPVFRLLTGDPLDRRLRDRASVWSPKENGNLTLQEARRLF